MVDNHDILGSVIEDARTHLELTRKELAEKLDVTENHLYSIERKNKKPSFELLSSLIQELDIPADIIFHPEVKHNPIEMERAVTMLRECSDKEIKIITVLIKELHKLEDKPV